MGWNKGLKFCSLVLITIFRRKRIQLEKVEITNKKGQLVLKAVYVITGLLMTGLGFLGIFLPLLPTTPFLLLAAWLFSRSSPRFNDWLLTNKWFGSYIKNYREKKGISIKNKIISVTTLWITILTTAVFFITSVWVRIVLGLIAATVTFHIVSFKTLPKE